MLRLLIRLFAALILIVVVVLISFRFAASIRESQSVQELAPASGSFVQIQTGSLYIQSAGPADGQAVLLAHGTAAWSGFWQNEIAMLGANGFRATAFDMPPFGFSDRATDGDYSRPQQAERILDLVKAMGTRPIMVAHSFGAAAAAEAVLQNPSAFSGFIIIDGALGIEDRPEDKKLPPLLRPMALRETAIAASATNPLLTKVLLRSLLYNKDAASQDLVDTLRLPQRRSGTTAAFAEWLPSLMTPSTNTLSRTARNYTNLSLPVRIIWGDKDSVTPPEQAEALARALDQEPVLYLKDVGHIPHIEAPAAFKAALLDALNDIMSAN
ncbi:MAG: alpha/beta hydrolase [Sulfitobacter sp.]